MSDGKPMYVGLEVRIVDPYNVGLISDHVELNLERETGSAFYRAGFDAGDGPSQLSFGGPTQSRGNPRGWKSIETLFYNQPGDEEDLIEEALGVAQEREVVLYITRGVSPESKIHWHPEGWDPETDEGYLKTLKGLVAASLVPKQK